MDLGTLARAILAVVVDGLDSTYATPHLHLFTNDFIPNDLTDVSAFIEPTGSWYAPFTTAFLTPYETGAGALIKRCTPHQFNYTGSDPAETVFGWFVTDSTDAVLLFSGRLELAVTLANDLDSVWAAPALKFNPVAA